MRVRNTVGSSGDVGVSRFGVRFGSEPIAALISNSYLMTIYYLTIIVCISQQSRSIPAGIQFLTIYLLFNPRVFLYNTIYMHM